MKLPNISKGEWVHNAGTVYTGRTGTVAVFHKRVNGDLNFNDPEVIANATASAAAPVLMQQLEECRAFISAALACTPESLADFIANNAEDVEHRAELALLKAGCTEENEPAFA